MSDVNKGGGGSVNAGDEIGTVWVEGLGGQAACAGQKHSTAACCASVYVGETLKYDVVVKKSNTQDLDSWKKQITRLTSQATTTTLSASSVPTSNTLRPHVKDNTSRHVIIVESSETEDATNGHPCPVLATFVGHSTMGGSAAGQDNHKVKLKDSSCKPYFRDDNIYVIPMSSHLQDVPGDYHFVHLQIVLWLYTVSVTRSDMSSELGPKGTSESAIDITKDSENGSLPLKKISVDVHELFGDDNDDDEDEEEDDAAKGSGGHLSLDLSPVAVSSSSRCVQEKTIMVELHVQGPPELRLRQVSAGQKQLILLAVNNKTEKQMVIKSIQMLSSSSPVRDISLVHEEGSSVKWETCHQVISLESPRRSHAFPVILSPWEELNLIYRLHLSSVPTDSELSLRANVKWTHAGASNEITTVYKIPRIKIRCPPFVVTVRCEEEIELSKTFFVTYTIANQLHDFTSMRLYYNLDNTCRMLAEHGGTEEEIRHAQHLKDSIVCHDPDTGISCCPRGSCVPVRVGFHIHKPGLYELSELMKVNLRYSLPDTQLSPLPDDRESHSPSSDTSISFQSTDDHLLASEELWRGRSGSTASLATPVIFQSAEERRRSFASKSYSFGDLGPTVSADSDEAAILRSNRLFKRSSAVLPPRPPPPRMLSQTERELIRPSNFLKQPFYIYVSDPLMT